jgi:ankyrin repeat protein
MNRHADFFAAIEAGDLSIAQKMLAADPELVDARDEAGAMALPLAAFNGHRQLVELLWAGAPASTPGMVRLSGG